jgi:hypothetical protein
MVEGLHTQARNADAARHTRHDDWRDLIHIKVGDHVVLQACLMQWHPITSAPFDRDLELAVIERDGPHTLTFACRRTPDGWIGAQTKQPIDVRPTHWREWNEA